MYIMLYQYHVFSYDYDYDYGYGYGYDYDYDYDYDTILVDFHSSNRGSSPGQGNHIIIRMF